WPERSRSCHRSHVPYNSVWKLTKAVHSALNDVGDDTGGSRQITQSCIHINRQIAAQVRKQDAVAALGMLDTVGQQMQDVGSAGWVRIDSDRYVSGQAFGRISNLILAGLDSLNHQVNHIRHIGMKIT